MPLAAENYGRQWPVTDGFRVSVFKVWNNRVSLCCDGEGRKEKKKGCHVTQESWQLLLFKKDQLLLNGTALLAHSAQLYVLSATPPPHQPPSLPIPPQYPTPPYRSAPVEAIAR